MRVARNPKGNACATIGRDNGVDVRKITPLGRINPNKHHCSVILHLAKKKTSIVYSATE